MRLSLTSPTTPPSGCRFHTRCPFAFDRCFVEVPPLREVEPGRMVAGDIVAENGGRPDAPPRSRFAVPVRRAARGGAGRPALRDGLRRRARAGSGALVARGERRP